MLRFALNIACKTIFCIISNINSFILIIIFNHYQNRAKYFFFGYCHIICYICKNCWFDEVTFITPIRLFNSTGN